MIIDVQNILVFKTNIRTKSAKKRVLGALNDFNDIERSTIDLDDTDCVLRIVSGNVTTNQIISTIRSLGIECTELE